MATKKKLLEAAAGNAGGGGGLNVEEVFSTYLYTGNGSTQTITNGIDLAGEGGLVWLKRRSASESHYLYDTERGIRKALSSDTAAAQSTLSLGLDTFNSDGFRLNVSHTDSGVDFATWTFRQAPKFFSVIKWTGDGTGDRTFTHGLNGELGSIVIKKLSGTSSWFLSHRSAPGGLTGYGKLDTTDAFSSTGSTITNVTSTSFDLGSYYNASGAEWVAYLFAHNDGDGEFGPNGDADIIKCGSYTGNGSTSGPSINLGFEPQWVLLKNASASGNNWILVDNMRGIGAGGPTIDDDYDLNPNLSNSESPNNIMTLTPTGFDITGSASRYNGSGNTMIYIAIRRGPMAVPESADEVFAIDTFGSTGDGKEPSFRSPFPVDMGIYKSTTGTSSVNSARLIQGNNLVINSTQAEGTSSWAQFDYQNGYYATDTSTYPTYYSWMWKRAPGFFDVVAYTGDGVAGRTVNHNLGVAPEMMWVKIRNSVNSWVVYHSGLDATAPEDYAIFLNFTNAGSPETYWNNTAPTDTSFTLGAHNALNGSSNTYIAYLFASLDGVSKVFSVTKSSGSDASVNCGFSAGPRFVLLKRTDSTGDWYVWDSERGIVAGNDPYLLLNSTAAEVTSTDYIDPTSNGFTIVNGGLADGDYIGYAVA